MASPPFNINESLPGDSDIVSQHPPNARTMRDVVESWLLTEHNVQGRHDKVSFDHSSDLTGIASVTRVWSDTSGNLKKVTGSGGTVEFILPTGVIIAYGAAAAPSGWLLCNGQAVSRTTFSRLFAIIGTTFGAGDGSTTFNVPNTRGYVLAGYDPDGTGILDSTQLGANPATLGAAGGSKSKTLITANLPVHNHSITDPGHVHTTTDPTHNHGVSDPTHVHGVSDPGHIHGVSGGTQAGSSSDSDSITGSGTSIPTAVIGITISSNTTGISVAAAFTGITTVANTTGITINSNTTGITVGNTGSATPVSAVQPTLLVNYIIKW